MLLGLPVLHLDTAGWQPGWVEAPTEDFKARVIAFMQSAHSGWVIDGNWYHKLGDLVTIAATDVICELPL
jgi:hypothetical protein